MYITRIFAEDNGFWTKWAFLTKILDFTSILYQSHGFRRKNYHFWEHFFRNTKSLQELTAKTKKIVICGLGNMFRSHQSVTVQILTKIYWNLMRICQYLSLRSSCAHGSWGGVKKNSLFEKEKKLYFLFEYVCM